MHGALQVLPPSYHRPLCWVQWRHGPTTTLHRYPDPPHHDTLPRHNPSHHHPVVVPSSARRPEGGATMIPILWRLRISKFLRWRALRLSVRVVGLRDRLRTLAARVIWPHLRPKPTLHVLHRRYPASVWWIVHWWLGVRIRFEYWLWSLGMGE